MSHNDLLSIARLVFESEIKSLEHVSEVLGQGFVQAISFIQKSQGRVVVVGMGKSGIVGKKIAATMASTGTPAFFVHPGEAFHGDLGMIQPMDVVLMISYSGETEELVRLLPFLSHQGNSVIAMTGNESSTLANHADAILNIYVEKEACNNNLAPTSSTTASLVMGDALAVVLATLSGFQAEDFARFHPGGSLGRKLLTKVKDVMHKGSLPICSIDSCFVDVLHTITSGRLGLAIVMKDDILLGVITDGDIRRALIGHENPVSITAKDIMTKAPRTINECERFSYAEQCMKDFKVSSLVVLDDRSNVVGVLQIYDLNK